MDITIVVATPNLALADLLLLSLEENDTYRVHLAHDLAELQEAVDSFAVELMIFDADFCDQLIDPLIQRVLRQHPHIRCIFLSPENDPEWMPDFPNAHYVLPQPYFISTIVELAETLLAPDSGSAKTLSDSSDQPRQYQPTWLLDREMGGFILTSFLRESTVHAVMVLVQGKVHLAQGYLSNAEVVEINTMIQREWNSAKQTDLVRFMKLQASGGKYLLYIREYQPDILLVLVEDIRNPVSNSKVQITRLQNMLMEQVTPIPVAAKENSLKPTDIEEQGVATTPPDETLLQTEVQSTEETEIETENALPDDESEEFDDEEQKEKLLKMLAWMPSPCPGNEMPVSKQEGNHKKQQVQSESLANGKVKGIPSVQQRKTAEEQIGPKLEQESGSTIKEPFELASEEPSESATEKTTILASEEPSELAFEKPTEMASEVPSEEPSEMTSEEQSANPLEKPSELIPEQAVPGELEGDEVAQGIPSAGDNFSDEFLDFLAQEENISEPYPEINDTLPAYDPLGREQLGEDEAQRIIPDRNMGSFPGAIPMSLPYQESAYNPEPAASAMADLIYTFVVIPRIPLHHLDGELEKQLSQWVPDLCIAFGWKLMRLQIRPEYILISTQVLPGVSPASVVRILRVKTSYRIFETHPRFRAQNPSGDFWAPGYLALSGVQMPDEELIADYMQQTRTRQGIPAAR